MATYCVGDIHGNFLGLQQCFERCNFNFEEDVLICLGDIVDGYAQVYECVELLMKVRYLVYIIGNHDQWFIDWMRCGAQPHIWTNQGGLATLKSYLYTVDERHRAFFNKGRYFYIDALNRLFVHGGFNMNETFENQIKEELMWDRSLIEYAMTKEKYSTNKKPIEPFSEIFVGHTATCTGLPIHALNVWGVDTGAGFDEKLTIMDVDSHQFWQSDRGYDLYGPNQGRTKIRET